MEDARDLTSPSVPVHGRSIQPGRRIGKYQILRHLATGGMAEVYLARATSIEQFQKLCVIKRILPTAAGDPAIVRMLIDEARIAATLHHSNVVQVFDMGEADGEYFICMEYLHGRDVQQITRATHKCGVRLGEDHALSIILGVCAGLHYAHDKTDDHGRPLGIVHRDISPTNVIVTYDGGVKLVDFGLVKAEGRMTESRSGSLKGKLAYMSPEQCRARSVDRRSDIFSLATMLWELTTGHRLFKGECDYDYLTAILEGEPARPSELIAGYPAVLEAIVMKGLAKNPDDRYQTCEELQLDLEDYCRERKLRVSPITLRRMMEELFADEIKEQERAQSEGLGVEDQVMRSLADGSTIGSRPPMSAENTSPDVQLTRVSRPIAAVSADGLSFASTSQVPAIPDAPAPAPARSRGALFAAIGVAVVAVAVAAFVIVKGGGTPAPASPPAALPTAPAATGLHEGPAPAQPTVATPTATAPAATPVATPTPTATPAATTTVATPTVPPTVPAATATTAPTAPPATATSATTPTRKGKRPPKSRPGKTTTPRGTTSKDLDSLFPE